MVPKIIRGSPDPEIKGILANLEWELLFVRGIYAEGPVYVDVFPKTLPN